MMSTRNKLVVVSVKMDPMLLKRLDDLAKSVKWTRSDVIRTAIEMLLSEVM